MYPPSTTQNRHGDVVGRSNGHGLTQVLRQDIWDGWLQGKYFPWTLRHNNKTWHGPKLCSGYRDLRWVTQRSERDSKDWLSAEVQRIMIWENDKVPCSRATLRSARWCSQETAWLAPFNFFPHPDRWVPIFNLTSSRRVTHARYNSPSVSSSSFV